jgi:hypothetical protein
MHDSGCVYFLPPEARTNGDPKNRRHVLLADCPDDADLATLAYASTQAKEANHRSPYVLVNPAASTYQRTGFDTATYVYPSRLICSNTEDLGEAEGRVIDDMPAIRDKVRAALGIGTGVASGEGPAAGSYRGCFIRLNDEFADDLGTEIAVVVTDPDYSRAERYWNVVPVIPLTEFYPSDGEVSIHESTASQLAGYDARFSECSLAVNAIQAVFFADEVFGVAPLCLDAKTLADLELALKIRFHL